MADRKEIAKQKLYFAVDAAQIIVDMNIKTLLEVKVLLNAITPENAATIAKKVNVLMKSTIKNGKNLFQT